MKRDVRHDGAGRLQIRFPYDPALVERVRALRGRRWHPDGKFWSAPDDAVIEIVELLHAHDFSFDEATCGVYRSRGGALEIRGDAGAEPGGENRPQADGLRVSQLNEQVRAALESAFPGPLWLVGEISSFNRAAHRRHVGFQLIERDADGRVASQVAATIFERTREEIRQTLAAAGDPFRLEDEIEVRLHVRVELYVPWGSYRVIVDAIDVGYTLGEAARRREEIVRRLSADGLLERNGSLPMPMLPLRVGLITSLDSDAYNDVLRTLQESGFAFELTVHGARVQGRSTEPSVLNALDALRRRADRLDVVLICRGGGSRTDLAWFDSEALGRTIALYPLPIVVGIGHEQDRSVLDAVARPAKTPTAAAALLVDTVRSSLDSVERAVADVLRRAAGSIMDQRQAHRTRGRRLSLAARSRLDRARVDLDHRRRRAIAGSRARLATERRTLGHRSRALIQGAARDLGTARRDLEQAALTLAPRTARRVVQERERTEVRDRRLALLHPSRVLERGYAVLRDAGNRVVSDVADAPPGTVLRAELRRGVLRLRADGPTEEER